MKYFHIALTIGIWSSFTIGTSVAGDILWDDSHHGGPFEPDIELDDQYAMFAQAIRGAGHTIKELNGSPGAITAAVLDGIEAFFLMDVEMALTTSELSLLHLFVEKGGGLFVSWEGGTINSRANPIIAPYGLSFSGNNDVFDDVPPINQLVQHSLTEGVAAFQIYGAALVNTTGTALPLIKGSDPRVFGVAQEGPKVVALGDSSMFHNSFIGDYDNLQLAVNIANYLDPIPEPQTAVLFCAGLPAIIGVRRRLTRIGAELQGKFNSRITFDSCSDQYLGDVR
jgi:hypothetical protein